MDSTNNTDCFQKKLVLAVIFHFEQRVKEGK